MKHKIVFGEAQKQAEKFSRPSADKKAMKHPSFFERPATAKNLLDILDDCRWPVADGLFCGAGAPHGSYCQRHHQLAFVRQTKK